MMHTVIILILGILIGLLCGRSLGISQAYYYIKDNFSDDFSKEILDKLKKHFDF